VLDIQHTDFSGGCAFCLVLRASATGAARATRAFGALGLLGGGADGVGGKAVVGGSTVGVDEHAGTDGAEVALLTVDDEAGLGVGEDVQRALVTGSDDDSAAVDAGDLAAGTALGSVAALGALGLLGGGADGVGGKAVVGGLAPWAWTNMPALMALRSLSSPLTTKLVSASVRMFSVLSLRVVTTIVLPSMLVTLAAGTASAWAAAAKCFGCGHGPSCAGEEDDCCQSTGDNEHNPFHQVPPCCISFVRRFRGAVLR
jgi:hypothetical protein